MFPDQRTRACLESRLGRMVAAVFLDSPTYALLGLSGCAFSTFPQSHRNKFADFFRIGEDGSREYVMIER